MPTLNFIVKDIRACKCLSLKMTTTMGRLLNKTEYLKACIRAKMEHSFG